MGSDEFVIITYLLPLFIITRLLLNYMIWSQLVFTTCIINGCLSLL